jgi:hypothetical protein
LSLFSFFHDELPEILSISISSSPPLQKKIIILQYGSGLPVNNFCHESFADQFSVISDFRETSGTQIPSKCLFNELLFFF